MRHSTLPCVVVSFACLTACPRGDESLTTNLDEVATEESTSESESSSESGTSESTESDTTETTDTGDPVCGDGTVEVGEECDNGPNNADDSDCTSVCTIAVCGDGLVQIGVEECDDANMVDTDDCTNACAVAVCGDMITKENVEECDDANMDNSDDCVDCSNAACGDGFRQMGVEDCDDGNLNNNDGCSSTCMDEPKIVFVTSTLHTGNLGGLAGADAICNARAQAAALPGTYKAWLSTSGVNGTPATRFTQSSVPYFTVNGVKVVDNWADLIDGTLDSPINVTETGGPPPDSTAPCEHADSVWTNTKANGTLDDPIRSCSNWTSTIGPSVWGWWNLTDYNWTAACGGVASECAGQHPFYCFQQ